MKIDKIILFNFGSYQGLTEFDTKVQNEKNIVLIGGKNGTGKTTLFTAIRLCLYGFLSMGYKNANSFYNKAVIRLMNNAAKLKKPTTSYVQIDLTLNNGQELDSYELKRAWRLDDSLVENFIVFKNGRELRQDEVADFEKYIFSIIPPELLNLYFFDGEKIADFFMSEASNARIKEAFLTLCGYDIFDIMRKNFKRISGTNSKSIGSLDNYIELKEKYEIAKNETSLIEEALKNCKSDIENCDAGIIALEKDYAKKGGITKEEWDQKLLQLKEEEKKRERLNAILKQWANEIIPFIMVNGLIKDLQSQIDTENNYIKYRNFCEIIESNAISSMLNKNGILLDEIEKLANKEYSGTEEHILDLSIEQSSILIAQINTILNFDAEKISKCKSIIKRSLLLTAKIRRELDNSNISSVQEYMQKRTELLELKNKLLSEQVRLEQETKEKKEAEIQLEVDFKKAQSKLEEELKNESINDIAAKSIVMLDHLQAILYKRQISRVQSFFKEEITTLMRKSNFIDDIYIDSDFNIHIYRNQKISMKKIVELINTYSESQLIALLGQKAVDKIKYGSASDDLYVVLEKLTQMRMTALLLPIEIDKSSLSNGEKQIFVMAVYHSLVQLCNHEIPFIIDTPFARIDTEHRQNISKYFFSKLNGQVFILSTNEEIDSEHIQIMGDRILATYLLENSGSNKSTQVIKNTYF